MILILCYLAQVASGTVMARAMFNQTSSDLTRTATLTQNDSLPPITAHLSATSNLTSELANITSSQHTSDDLSSTVTTSYPLSPISSLSSLFTSWSVLPLLPSTTIVTEISTVLETATINVVTPSTNAITVVTTATTSTPAAATSTPLSIWNNRTIWTIPPRMSDLSAFNITYFPSGEQNLQIVTQIPSHAMAPIAKSLRDPSLFSNITTSTILQLVYPAESVNPSSEPEGGAEFYATPLNLSGAHNVTLGYSVFFPADFNWVKGGKLPGLFGGHTGCSGGASARDCFSTRLMWRPKGAGELYLYAPKDRQTEALCADAASVCDNAYGFSIGRGAFNFTAGDWTHLKQTVVLNTPGENDGMFTLFVDGQPMIHRSDMFYRHVVPQIRKNKPTAKPEQPVEFIGLFFSTFFGGHGKAYATPKEQYTWLKDFSITRHD